MVVQDPNNGELLAVANWPTFDPNDPGSYPDEARMDRAVSAAYEPGSTFKVITLTGAIENGVTQPDDTRRLPDGQDLVAGRLIHDWHPFGVHYCRQNPGALKRCGRDQGGPAARCAAFLRHDQVFRNRPADRIELPGENRGLLRPLGNWSPSSIGSIAMGQEVSVTPIQIISAISAIANGGTLYRPRIVRDMLMARTGVPPGPDRRPAM